MKYQVFDGNKPADCHGHKVDKSWDKSIFDTFEEAYFYAQNWLGQNYAGMVLKLNTPADYSGYGDIIEIRSIKNGS